MSPLASFALIGLLAVGAWLAAIISASIVDYLADVIDPHDEGTGSR